MNINCSGNLSLTCQDFALVEGADVSLTVATRIGQGAMGVEKFLQGVMKLINSIA